MTLDEFLCLVESEPAITIDGSVRINSPALLGDVSRRGGMRLDDFIADPRHSCERRVRSYGHVLGAGVTHDAIARWSAAWPRHPLPADLRELLGRVNGIHLWASLETGRSYEGIAPLGEWGLARTIMWGPHAAQGMLDDRYLALSYHSDGAAFAVLDVDAGRYFLMDAGGADASSPIGSTVGDLLDWVWRGRGRPPGAR